MKYSNQLQEQVIAKHLLAGKSITGLQALRLYGCYRLSNVILSLRREWGMDIETMMIQNGRKRFAKYTLLSWRHHSGKVAAGPPLPRRERMKILGTARGMK